MSLERSGADLRAESFLVAHVTDRIGCRDESRDSA